MRLRPSFLALLLSAATQVQAEQPQNYHECLSEEASQLKADEAEQSLAVFCTSRHFDTAPTAFQAQVLIQDLEGMKQRDPKFKAFYDGIRQHSSNAIYSDRQIVLMYIDKREVKKD